MKFLFILILLLVSLVTSSCAQEGNQTPIIDKLEIPKVNSGDEVINHTGYSLLYNEEHEQAKWVALMTI